MRATLNILRLVGLRHLLENKKRAILTMAGVAAGVALFTAIDLINRATLTSFRENFTALAGTASLSVTAGEAGFPQGKLETLEKVPGVRVAVPMVEERVYFKEGTETLVVFGVDMLRETSVRTYKATDERLMDDTLVFLNHPDSIILSSVFAERHGLKVGSRLQLATSRGGKHFTVRGILRSEGPAKAHGGSIALMDIDGARITFGKLGKFDRVDLVADAGEEAEELANRVRAVLGPGYQVERPGGQADQMARLVKGYQRILSLMSILAMLVGLFMVTTTISMAVTERRKEIGILRAIGTTRFGILLVFLAEASLLGLAGAVAGGLLGWLGACRLVEGISKAMAAQYMTNFTVPEIQWQLSDLARATLVGLSASLAAAGWPAFRATRVQPIEAIRQHSAAGLPGQLPSRYAWIGFGCLAFLQLSSSLEISARFLWVEAINQMASTWGTVLITPWAVNCLSRGTSALTRHLSVPFRLSQENLRKEPLRVSGNVLMLMTGLILLVLVSTVNASFRQSISDWMNKMMRADLLIASPGQIHSYKTQPLHQDLRTEIESIPGLREDLAYPVTGMRFLHLPYGGRKISVKAFDRPAPENMNMFDVKDGDAAETGRALFAEGPLRVLVSRNFASRFRKRRGESIELPVPGGAVSAQIAGVVNDFSSSDGVLYIDRARYAELFRDPLVTILYVKLKDSSGSDAARRLIDSRYGQARNLVVRTNAELRSDLLLSVDRNFAYAKAIEGAALLIALLGILNALYASVIERTREIGMLRAIGMTRLQVVLMVTLESLAQGLAASILAVLLGSWMAYLWVRHSLEGILGWSVQFHFPFESVLAACGLGLAVALLAGLLPALRAAGIGIKEALGHE